MSGSLAQQPIWTPPVIATIVYRVVMIIVSIAFIWKKYRRPARQIDGNVALLTITLHSSLHYVDLKTLFMNHQSHIPPLRPTTTNTIRRRTTHRRPPT
jgi:hypothetical protein